MNKSVVEIQGFEELRSKIKLLPDKLKKREVNKILGQVANSTIKKMRELAPAGDPTNKGFSRKKRQIGKTVIADNYTPGFGKKTIGKATMNKSKNAYVVVGPRSRKGKDGYYLRQWVIPGTKYFKGNSFIEAAFNQTKGKVSADAVAKVGRYLQKQINKL